MFYLNFHKCLNTVNANYFLMLSIFCFTSLPADSQSSFPLVLIEDYEANIASTVQKSYVTTVGLVPTGPDSRFVIGTFIDAAEPFYSTEIDGYISIRSEDVISSRVSATLELVTYTVRYSLNIMRSNGVTDDRIRNSLGSYQVIRANIGSVQHQLANFFTFQADADNFVFTGENLCNDPEVTCNGSEVSCTEELNGVSILCVSPCKLGYCQNNGTCAQTSKNSTPTCACLSSLNLWFLGAQCEVTVSLWWVIVVAVGCFITIVVVVVLSCCFYNAKVKRERKKLGLIKPHAYKNYAFTPDEKEKTSVNPITRNGNEDRKIEARPEPVVFRSRSFDESSHLSRGRSENRNDGHRRSNRSPDSSETSSASSFSSGSFESSPDGADENQTSTPISSVTSLAASAHPDPSAHSTNSCEFGNTHPNDVYLNTRDQGTSPIRWYPSSRSPKPMPDDKMGKVNIAERKGWLPSLGPQMFDLKMAQNNEAAASGRAAKFETDI